MGIKYGRLAICLAAASLIGACANGPAAAPEDDAAGSLQGELSVISVFGSDERSALLYRLRVADRAGDLPLLFDRDPQLSSHSTIRVWGVERADGYHVSRHAVIEPAEDGSEHAALIGQASTTRTVAWVQMDVNGGGVNQTQADGQRLIFGQNAGPLFGTRAGDRSLVQYYDETSFGTLKLTGQVEGPIPFTGTACDNFDPLARDVVAKVTALGRTYDHYYLFWGSMQSCGAGWGAQGTHNRPGKYVWLNNNGTFCTATGQEIGHNFGLMHASTMRCPNNVTLANDTSTCTSNEYGNPMTVMGGGCRHLIAVEKWYSLFLQGCNGVKVKSSGTFTLFPIETACNGIQALQIPFPSSAPTRTTTTSQSNGNVTNRFYYLELRGGHGMDTGIKTGVYVHIASDIPAPTANGPRTFLLDMNPANTSWDPMTVGQTFTDPAGGVSFTLNSADTNQASVTVTIEGGTAANTCIDGSTVAGTGPASCGDATTGTGGAGGGGSGGGGAGGATGTAGRGGTGGAAGGSTGGTAARGGTGGGAGTGMGGSGAGGRGGSGGGAGNAGTAGAAGGTTGAAGSGSTGTGGSAAGTTGSTGSGGSAAGTTGTSGAAGTTGAGGVGATGSAGTTGTTGTAGSGSGSAGTTGTGTAGSSGGISGPIAGAAGGPGQAGSVGQKGEVSGGCSCELAASSDGRGAPWLPNLALVSFGVGLIARRRRSRR